VIQRRRRGRSQRGQYLTFIQPARGGEKEGDASCLNPIGSRKEDLTKKERAAGYSVYMIDTQAEV